jgi:hypothetical protein
MAPALHLLESRRTELKKEEATTNPSERAKPTPPTGSLEAGSGAQIKRPWGSA